MRLIEKLKETARRLRVQTWTLYLACRDPRTPWYAKAWGAVVVAYAFSPIDLIPDFIPVLGYLDDLILVPLGVALALRMIPKEVLADCRKLAEQRMARKKPGNWVAGAVVIAVWVGLAAFVAWKVISGLRTR